MIKILKKNNKGQVLVLAVVVLAALAIGIISLIDVGSTIHHKIVLQDAADAAAYSGAVWEARFLNFAAYTNRAMVAHLVTVSKLTSMRSFIDMCTELIGKPPQVPKLASMCAQIERPVDQFSGVLIGLGQTLNELISKSQLQLFELSKLVVPAEINRITSLNAPDSLVNGQLTRSGLRNPNQENPTLIKRMIEENFFSYFGNQDPNLYSDPYISKFIRFRDLSNPEIKNYTQDIPLTDKDNSNNGYLNKSYLTITGHRGGIGHSSGIHSPEQSMITGAIPELKIIGPQKVILTSDWWASHNYHWDWNSTPIGELVNRFCNNFTLDYDRAHNVAAGWDQNPSEKTNKIIDWIDSDCYPHRDNSFIKGPYPYKTPPPSNYNSPNDKGVDDIVASEALGFEFNDRCGCQCGKKRCPCCPTGNACSNKKVFCCPCRNLEAKLKYYLIGGTGEASGRDLSKRAQSSASLGGGGKVKPFTGIPSFVQLREDFEDRDGNDCKKIEKSFPNVFVVVQDNIENATKIQNPSVTQGRVAGEYVRDDIVKAFNKADSKGVSGRDTSPVMGTYEPERTAMANNMMTAFARARVIYRGSKGKCYSDTNYNTLASQGGGYLDRPSLWNPYWHVQLYPFHGGISQGDDTAKSAVPGRMGTRIQDNIIDALSFEGNLSTILKDSSLNNRLITH